MILFRCVSSAWLEYMPVTHGVTGSSPVRTAATAFLSGRLCCFYAYLTLTRSPFGSGLFGFHPHQASQVESRTHRNNSLPFWEALLFLCVSDSRPFPFGSGLFGFHPHQASQVESRTHRSNSLPFREALLFLCVFDSYRLFYHPLNDGFVRCFMRNN